MAIPQDRSTLEALRDSKLRAQVQRVVRSNPFYSERWAAAGVDVDRITTCADIVALPFIAKDDLLADQELMPPFGRRLGVVPKPKA